jgi:hypothetical protein
MTKSATDRQLLLPAHAGGSLTRRLGGDPTLVSQTDKCCPARRLERRQVKSLDA